MKRVVFVYLLLFVKFNGMYAEGNRYELIQQSLIEGNYSYAEKLIEQEKKLNVGDPKLEFYEIELWLKKANELYEKKQFKDSLAYYYKLGAIYPNHPTVRERIDLWKHKNPENEVVPKLLLAKKIDPAKESSPQLDFSEFSNGNQNTLISLNERLVNLTFEISHLKSNLQLFVGVAIGLAISNLVSAILLFLGRLKK